MSINDRAHDAEARFGHEQELRFRVEARRNKLLGLWAADKLGKSGAEADAYAAALVQLDLGAGGSEDVYQRVRADFDAAAVAQSEHQIRRHMEEFLTEAQQQVAAS
ncbi:DUF1476 domain-containing protein [Aureimonas sp. AU12]|uniref:DUF1476 domain-containing protein n=1 Tax=Aureimonas sp. AU12 TaxID=1638161 RepID=UPI0007864389|nr:DUF1476 domain-containing protein [Aureimonas sp. AU12]